MKYVKTSLIVVTLFFSCLSCTTREIEQSKYINWLKERSMLYQAATLARELSGKGIQWQHPYALPQTEQLLKTASVWFTAYPSSFITREGETIIQAMGSEDMWKTFEKIGIRAMHTGPLKRAGGIKGYEYTPTVDGWFDRISYTVDPLFGDDGQYQKMVQTAQAHQAIIIGDIIPGHTGKGADFHLAERNYMDYPGLYCMVEIKKEDWGLLLPVPEGEDSVNLPPSIVDRLREKGYIVGQLERVLYSVPGRTGLTGWDATDAVTGADGKERRWVYLHYFRPGQPTLNWLDPSFAANRLIAGDIIKTRLKLGASIIRLDATPFLGIETKPGSEKCWSEGHPLSVVSTDEIAWLMRKLGGWSFQELNLAIEDIRKFSRNGPDLSYDFITRPAYNHALLTGDAAFLRLMLKLMKEGDVKPIQLIHALQNHDEITYELVHFAVHGDELFPYQGKRVRGQKLRDSIIEEMHSRATGSKFPYNKLSGNGLCTTFAGFCAAAFGIEDPYHMTPGEKEMVKKGHLLMAMFNAMQPGVFAISGWDLVGALPLPEDQIKDLLADGDYRWINRGAYDLMDTNPGAKKSSSGLPKAQALYGSLPEQLKDPDSFVSKLKEMLKVRKDYHLDLAELIALPEVKNQGVILMVHRLPDDRGLEVTALNFGRKPAEETLQLDEIKGKSALNLLSKQTEGRATEAGEFTFNLAALEGKILLFTESQ